MKPLERQFKMLEVADKMDNHLDRINVLNGAYPVMSADELDQRLFNATFGQTALGRQMRREILIVQ